MSGSHVTGCTRLIIHGPVRPAVPGEVAATDAGVAGYDMDAVNKTPWEPVVEVDMLVRRPAAEVWEAFADPDLIRRFWLARSTGRLETGAVVTWSFKVADAETDVTVIEAVPGILLDLRWDDGQPLRISFENRGDSTLVMVRVTDFGGDTPAANAIESMSGFTLVLASLKMYVEHGIEGDLMYDKFPDAAYADR